jgi:hypothetical protein
VKTDVARSSHRKARGRNRRLLPRLHLLHDDGDWPDANRELALARGHWDHYENLLAHVLQRAADKGWLTQADSWALLELFRDGRPAKDGRPSALPDEQRSTRIMAMHSHLLELSGNPKTKTEAAVAETARLYGVHRSTVFAARRRAKIPQETLDRWRLDPEQYLAICQGALEVRDVLKGVTKSK